MSLSSFAKIVVAANERFEKEVQAGIRVNDIKGKGGKYLNKAGIYEVVAWIEEMKNGNAIVKGETDSGESFSHTQYLTTKDDISASGYYNLFKAMGGIELKLSLGYLKEIITVPVLINEINEAKGKKFRCKIKAGWRPNTLHPVYVDKGQYTLFDADEKQYMHEGFDVTAGSVEELDNFCKENGLTFNKWMVFSLQENVIPIEESKQEKPVAPVKPKTMGFAPPVAQPVAQPTTQTGGDDVPF